MKIISLETLKTFLEKSDTTHDVLLGMILDQVSSRIERFLNRNLLKTERTKYFNAGRRLYYLPAYPIDLTETLTVLYDGSEQTINDDFWVWEDQGLIEFQTSLTYNEPKQVSITWTGGYAETAISEVLGTDDLNYRCILGHVAQVDTRPISGPDYDKYWEKAGTSGVVWVTSSSYVAESSLSGVPDDIRLATLLQCAFIFRKRDAIGVRGITTPDGSITSTLPLDLLPEVKTYLRDHRRSPAEI